MTIEEDEDPEVFFLRLDEKRNELALLGKAIDDDDVPAIILGQLPPFYDRVKCQAESQEDFNIEEAMIVMRNMHANRVEEEGRAPRAAKGRSSAMAASTAKLCTFCKTKGHKGSNCFEKNNKPAGNTSGGRNGDWCTLHKTSRHDNSNCREQQQNNGGGNGRHQQGRRRGQGQRNNNNNNGRRRNQGGQQHHRNHNNGSYNGGNHNNDNYNGGNHNNGNYNYGNHQQAYFGQIIPAPSSITMVPHTTLLDSIRRVPRQPFPSLHPTWASRFSRPTRTPSRFAST